MGRHKNKRLTPEVRRAIVQQYDRQPQWRQQQLAQWAADTFKLDAVPSQPTISVVLRQGGRFMGPSRTRRPKPVKCPQLEAAMVQWLEQQIEKDEPITVSSVQARAEQLQSELNVTVEGFSVSPTWVDCFIRQHLLNCPFTSDSEDTDAESAAKTQQDASKKPVKGARTPRPSSAKSSGKRKRESEGSRQVRARK